MTATFKRYSITYVISPCVEDDIKADYEYVRHLVTDTGEELYKDYMLDSVNQKLAYRITNDTNDDIGFMYTYIEDNVGYGASMFGNCSPLIFMYLVYYILNDYPATRLLVQSHTTTEGKNTIEKFKIMFTLDSLKRWRNGTGCPTIVVKDIKERFKIPRIVKAILGHG